ncbi:MAG: hypothetical protein Ct9H90mP11_07840 [Acidimicrobiales bacterium]|nr:MAG: hypothetical protein Ct9H90mP11_07840 [Acidimicrobiales bacterium]
MTTTHGNPTTSANVVDVSAPGAIPYVELSAKNFGEILLSQSQSQSRLGRYYACWTDGTRLQTDQIYS